MKKSCVIALAGLLCCILVLGCTDNGKKTGFQPGVSIKVGASIDMSVITKLDQGAEINVYNFRTGQKITTAAIGADGYGITTITPGLSVVIVVTGKRASKDYRLSVLVPLVPNGNAVFIANPETTAAAELLGQRFYKKSLIDLHTYNLVLDAAEDWYVANEEPSFAIGDGLLFAGAFGTNGDIDQSKFASIIAVIPSTINDNVVKGKDAIQQVKEAGLPLRDLLQQERPSVDRIVDAVNTSFESCNLASVQASYTLLNAHLSTFLLPAIQGDWELVADGNATSGDRGTSIFDLVIGQGYRAKLHTETDDGFTFTWLTFFPDNTLNTPNQITVKLDVPSDVFTLIAKKTSSGWVLDQTAQIDTLLKYHVTIPIVTLGANPSVTGTFSISDKDITTPVVFNGTASATGKDKQHYTRIEFAGDLTSKEVIAKGTFVTEFNPVVPAGAASGKSIYNFPTTFTMSNASITIKSETTTVLIHGSILAKASVLTSNGVPSSYPTEFQLDNGMISTTVAGSTITITGEMKVLLSYAAYNNSLVVIPTEFSLTNNAIQLKTIIDKKDVTLTMGGSLSATAKKVLMNGKPTALPTDIKLTGNYANSDSKLTFNGTLEAKLSNPSDNLKALQARGTLSMIGDITQDRYQPYAVNILFSTDGNGKISCDINTLKFGNYSITGSASAKLVTVGNNTNVTMGTLTLINQDDVKLFLQQGTGSTVTGKMTVGADQVATIAPGPPNNTTTITFNDGTTELIF